MDINSLWSKLEDRILICLCLNFKNLSEDENDNKTECYAPNPCSKSFDLYILVQSSDKITYIVFERIKSIISEMISRYRIKENQVHVAIGVVTEETRYFNRALRRDQTNLEVLLSKIEEISYVSYSRSDLKRAIRSLSRQMEIQNDRTKVILEY